MDVLKHCPFCGGEAKLFTARGKCNQIVRCVACNVSPGYRQTKKEAIEAWNNRAERTCQLLRLKNEDVCSFCGYTEEVDSAYIPNNYCPNCGAKVVVEQ